MELFNEENFSREFKQTLGFVHADLSYIRLRPDIVSAVDYVQDIISKPVYDEILKDKDKEAYKSLKYAVSIEAYRLHAPTSDLAHTNDGRKMISDETYKTAFEWMTDRDDENLQLRSDRAIDSLLNQLEKETYFKESEAYKEYSSLHVNTLKKFSKIYPISSRLLFLRLKPYLKECEVRQIYPRLQRKISEIDDPLLSDLITEACVFYALSKGFTRLRASLFDTGAAVTETSYSKSRKSPDGHKIEQLSQLYMLDAEKTFLEIEIKANPDQDDYDGLGFEFNTDSKFVSS